MWNRNAKRDNRLKQTKSNSNFGGSTFSCITEQLNYISTKQWFTKLSIDSHKSILKLTLVCCKLQTKYQNNLEMAILPIMILCSVGDVTVVAEKGFS